MNRNTTKMLGTAMTVGTTLLGALFFLGDTILSIVSKVVGRDLTFDGFGIFIFFPVGFLGVLVIVILSFVVHFRKKSHRQEDLQKFAQQNSFIYTQSTTLPFLKEFNLFLNDSWSSNALTGSSNNVLTGKMNERNFVVSDQIYSTGSGKHRTTHEITIVGIELPEAQLPIMCLYPEGFMDKVLDTVSKFDIDFENRPLFSQKYVLYGRNENHIRSFFNDKILAFYEQQSPFTTVCGGKYLVIYGDGLLRPDQIMARLKFIFNLANLFLNK